MVELFSLDFSKPNNHHVVPRPNMVEKDPGAPWTLNNLFKGRLYSIYRRLDRLVINGTCGTSDYVHSFWEKKMPSLILFSNDFPTKYLVVLLNVTLTLLVRFLIPSLLRVYSRLLCARRMSSYHNNK